MAVSVPDGEGPTWKVISTAARLLVERVASTVDGLPESGVTVGLPDASMPAYSAPCNKSWLPANERGPEVPRGPEVETTGWHNNDEEDAGDA